MIPLSIFEISALDGFCDEYVHVHRRGGIGYYSSRILGMFSSFLIIFYNILQYSGQTVWMRWLLLLFWYFTIFYNIEVKRCGWEWLLLLFRDKPALIELNWLDNSTFSPLSPTFDEHNPWCFILVTNFWWTQLLVFHIFSTGVCFTRSMFYTIKF